MSDHVSNAMDLDGEWYREEVGAFPGDMGPGIVGVAVRCVAKAPKGSMTELLGSRLGIWQELLVGKRISAQETS